MRLKHKVRINVADRNGHKQVILQSQHKSIPKRLLTFLFGEFCEVLVLTLGETVQGIEIRELRSPRSPLRRERTSSGMNETAGLLGGEQYGACGDERGDGNE